MIMKSRNELNKLWKTVNQTNLLINEMYLYIWKTTYMNYNSKRCFKIKVELRIENIMNH